jgi:molybdopterin-guanine dinucleotide biosynthesis protein A
MPSHGAILLCGGRSARMGRAKAWLPWRGRTLCGQVASVLAQVVEEIVVVTSAALEPPPLPRSVRVVRDAQEGLGPLAGLAAGLGGLEADAAFAIGTDVPFLTPAFVRRVLAAAGAQVLAAAGAQAAVAPVIDGFVQPLGAAYPRRGAAIARELLASGKRRPLDLVDALGVQPLAAEDLPDRDSLRGLDTPAEYLAAVARDGQPGRATLELAGRARALAGCARLEVAIGTLGHVLAQVPGGGAICRGERVAPEFRVSLAGCADASELAIPVGPLERVSVADARP